MSEPDATTWLLHVLAALDRTPREDTAGTALVRRISAAMCVHFADHWMQQYRGSAPNVHRTVEAASAYLTNAGAAEWATFFRACTASYAFGPGDGCHTIPDLGPGCGPGTGCRTGIGWVWSLTYTAGATAVRNHLRFVLGPEESARFDTECAGAAG